MAINRTNRFIDFLCRSSVHDGIGRTDGELLHTFIHEKDGAALAALVRRHGPMVWGVCSRMLHSHHDAEDTFQATFLVLVQKAATLPDRETVGNWLYGVAQQTAVRMRALAARRGVRERQVAAMPEPTLAEEYVWNDLQPILDEELARLPDKYRVLIVLCDLAGNTRKEVARQLKIPEGTVASRLATARTMLAKRLSRRGVVVSGVLLGTTLSSHAASACVPMPVVSSTVKAATLVAVENSVVAGVVSPTVASLIQAVTKAMFMSKVKSVLAAVLVAGLVLCGTGVAMLLVSEEAVAVAQQPPGATAKAADDAKKTPAAVPAKGKLDALQQKLVGTWIGQGPCVGNTVFQADGTYHSYGYGPGAGHFESGTWKIDWSELPPTLVLNPLPTEATEADDPKETPYHLIKLNDKHLYFRWSKHSDARIEQHRRGTEMDDVTIRINILNSAVQRFLGNQKHGAGVNLPPTLQTLVDTKVLPSSKSLLDPWGKEFRYDLSGKHHKGKKPDIWTETKDKKIIGNWPEEK